MDIDYYNSAIDLANSKRFTDWKRKFIKTDLYKRLDKEYDIILDWFDLQPPPELNAFILPRKIFTTKFTTLVGFYLIENYLNTKEKILDVGCGTNYWKTYYDVHGVDPVYFAHAHNEYEVDMNSASGVNIGIQSNASNWIKVYGNSFDSKVELDKEQSYFKKNKGTYKNIMSQCALHFSSDIQNNLKDFYGLLGKNGKAFASLNLIRLFEQDNSTSLTNQLKKLDLIEDIIEEVIVIQNPNAAPLDGNLHVIFKNT